MSIPQPASSNGPAARVSLQGALLGARRISVLMPGITVFAVAFGAAAAAKGLSLFEAMLMSATVYAGVAQLVAMELWRPEWSWGAIVGLAAVTATVNARMVLQGASLQPWLRAISRARSTPCICSSSPTPTGSSRRATAPRAGNDLGVMFGSGMALWVVWVGMTGLGYGLGALVADPRAYGIDLVMPIFFASMIVPLWRGRRAAVPWVVAGLVALVTAKLVDGYLFIVVGSLSGALVGAFLDDAA
jgi:predicted branched-subunit amino acid permease